MKRTSDAHVPILQHAKTHRETLLRQKEQVPVLQAQRQRLCEIRDACGTRRTALRRSRDMAAAIAELDRRIERLATDEHMREFERDIVPYLEAYVKQSGVAAKQPRPLPRFLVPGEAEDEKPRASERQAPSTSQSEVVAEYLSAVQGDTPRPCIDRQDMCPACAVDMVLVPAKALLACPKCGRSASFLDATTSSISYDENPEMVTFCYKRGSHFQDWLQNVQGLESYRVSQEVIDAVMHELYKQRVTNLDDITTVRVRSILKSMKLRKCYDHVAQIRARITGRPLPRLPVPVVELLKLMFTAVQGPFRRHSPPSRKNFLSYSFILGRMLNLVGYDELSETLTMLKSQDKLRRMHEVWKLIAADLDWECPEEM